MDRAVLCVGETARPVTRPTVALFVTCLVDAMRPSVGFASLKVLEEAGYDVVVPPGQTCCGQPALNSGDRAGAEAIAKATIACLEPYDTIVVPSGSCGGTIKAHYPELFEHDAAWLARAQAVAAKTHEILSFLDAAGWRPAGVTLTTSAAYHDSCSGLRELGIKRQPRALLDAVDGLEQVALKGAETCCGFGGTFCVKYPAISNAVVEEKAQAIEDSGAALLLAGDLGCLMNMAGKLHRRGAATRAFHTVEILAGMGDGPAIGENT